MFISKYIKGINFLSFKEFYFEFRNGQAILIQGQNLDDTSQVGNGSGKSALIEAVSFAATGKSIRDVVVKDLIYSVNEKPEKFLEVEWYLENPAMNTSLKIKRTVFSNTTAAKAELWINGVQKTDIPDYLEYAKHFFDNLGISKEDFFNFYLITSDNGFKPFLNAGDAKKKEIINRFSGADKVDNVTPLIDVKSNKKQAEIDQINKQLTQIQANSVMLLEQVEAEEKKADPANNVDALQAKYDHIENIQKNIGLRELDVKDVEYQIGEQEKEIAAFKPTDYAAQIKEKEEEKTKLNTELESLKTKLSECKNAFDADIQKIKTDEDKLRADIDSTRKMINEYQQFIDDVNNKLKGSIDCPACGHKFNLQDKEFNATEALESLPEAELELTNLKTTLEKLNGVDYNAISERKQEVNKKVVELQEKVKEDVYQVNQKIVAKDRELLDLKSLARQEQEKLDGMKSKLRTYQQNLESYKRTIENHKTDIQTTEKQIDLLNNVDTSRLDELNTKLLGLIEQEEELNQKLQVLTDEKKNIDEWYTNFKNFKSHLANKSIKNIQDYTNLHLKAIGSNITIEIDGYRLLANKKLKEEITTIVKKDGFVVGAYGKFSKGERGRVDISNVLANQELINVNSPTGGLDLLLADEILDAVDVLGLESIIGACQSLGKTIMIVSQNQINSLPKYTLTIQKKDKVSKIFSNN